MVFIAATEGENPLIPPLGEIIIGLIAFGLLCLVLMRYVFPRMEQTFRERRDAIEGGIERAEQAQAEAQRLLNEYRRQLGEARTEAAQIREEARAQAQRITEELRAEAQAEQARIVQRGEEQLTAQRQQVIRELRGEIGDLAVRLAERIVGESLAEDLHRQGTIDRFLDDLEGMAAAVPAAAGAGSGPGGTGAGGTGAGGPGAGGGAAGGTGAGGTGDARASGGTDGRSGGESQGRR